MDFTEYLYKNIGERVRLDRQTKKMNLSTYSRHISQCTYDKKVKETGNTQNNPITGITERNIGKIE